MDTLSNETIGDAVEANATAHALSASLHNVNNTLLVSIANATAGKKMAIETINDTVTRTRDEISDLEDRTLFVMNLLSQLQSGIESIALVPQGQYDIIATSLTELEAMSDAIGAVLATATSDVEELDMVSRKLDGKYTEVLQHRDLLQDIQFSLEKLDCQVEYRK